MTLQLTANEVFKFFQEHTLRARWHELFNNTNIVRERIYEILNGPILKDYKGVGDYSYSFIFYRFKYYFFCSLLNEAVEVAITNPEKTDLLANVLELINEERLQTAVNGQMMIDAFIDVIQNVKTESALESALKGSKIYRLQKEYLG